MLTKEEYFSYYYKNNKTIDQSSIPNNSLNERQLESKYKKYEKRFQVKDFQKDENWEKTRSLVYSRDNNTCQLIIKLSFPQLKELKINSNGLWKVLTPAHIFGKGSYPKLKYFADNVITLNQYSHSMLDNCCDPINGNLISKKERDKWWEFIIGSSNYKKLKEKAYS